MKTSAIYSIYEKLPRPGQLVMVEAALVRCFGFLDPERGWCDVRDGHIIENVESWSPLDIGHDQMRDSARAFGDQSRKLTTG